MKVKRTEINVKSENKKTDSGKIIMLALRENKKFKQPMVCN